MKVLYLDCSNSAAEEIVKKVLDGLAEQNDYVVSEISQDRLIISPNGTEHPHYHPTFHSEDQKKTVLNRLSRIIGHLESIKRMVEDNRDANDVLVQLSAVASSVNSTARVIIKNHFKYSITTASEANDDETFAKLEGLIDKFLK